MLTKEDKIHNFKLILQIIFVLLAWFILTKFVSDWSIEVNMFWGYIIFSIAGIFCLYHYGYYMGQKFIIKFNKEKK